MGGRDISDCDGTSCGYSVCQNGGTCRSLTGSDFHCLCTDRFYGETCNQSSLCRNHVCGNHGICVPDERKEGYSCYCLLGWHGFLCSRSGSFVAAGFQGNSYLQFMDPDYSGTNRAVTQISLTFRTTQGYGLLLWNGQVFTEDDDYLGVGLTDGRVQVVWNLGWFSREEVLTDSRYNDGLWHTLLIYRDGQSMTVAIDDGPVYTSQVLGEFTDLDTQGVYFLGGFGFESVEEETFGLYKQTFIGCLKDLKIHGQYIELQKMDYGLNVKQCDENG